MSVKVDYQLEPADFIAIAQEQRRFIPDSLSRLYYFAVLPALGVGLAIAAESIAVGAVFTILFITSCWLIQERTQRLYRRNIYSNENLSFSARRWGASLSDEGIRITSDAAEVLYRWPFVRKVFRASRYLCFELTPLQRVHIPLRAFRDEEHIQQFVQTAQSYVKTPAA